MFNPRGITKELNDKGGSVYRGNCYTTIEIYYIIHITAVWERLGVSTYTPF